MAYLGEAEVSLTIFVIDCPDVLHADKVIVLRPDEADDCADDSAHAERHQVACEHDVVLERVVVVDFTVANLKQPITSVSHQDVPMTAQESSNQLVSHQGVPTTAQESSNPGSNACIKDIKSSKQCMRRMMNTSEG